MSLSDTNGGSRFDDVKQKNIWARMRLELLKADEALGREVWEVLKDKQRTEIIAKQTPHVAPKSVEEFLLWRVEDVRIE